KPPRAAGSKLRSAVFLPNEAKSSSEIKDFFERGPQNCADLTPSPFPLGKGNRTQSVTRPTMTHHRVYIVFSPSLKQGVEKSRWNRRCANALNTLGPKTGRFPSSSLPTGRDK